MIDRRSQLKRLGMAGLAIPAAALLETQLVLPAQAQIPPPIKILGTATKLTKYTVHGLLLNAEIRLEWESIRALSAPHISPLRGPTIARLEVLVDTVTLEELEKVPAGQVVDVSWNQMDVRL